MSRFRPDQPPGVDEDAEEFQLPDPAEAAQRILAYVAAFGDGRVACVNDDVLFARDLEAVARAIGTQSTEWGVRYPAGNVEKYDTEAEARRWAICCTGLRPDLPLLVVRKTTTATEWEPVK